MEMEKGIKNLSIRNYVWLNMENVIDRNINKYKYISKSDKKYIG